MLFDVDEDLFGYSGARKKKCKFRYSNCIFENKSLDRSLTIKLYSVMIRPMFGHRAKPRKFEIPLRYYDPKEDEKRKSRIRLKSNFNRNRHRSQNIRVIVYALGLALVIWIIAVL